MDGIKVKIRICPEDMFELNFLMEKNPDSSFLEKIHKKVTAQSQKALMVAEDIFNISIDPEYSEETELKEESVETDIRISKKR